MKNTSKKENLCCSQLVVSFGIQRIYIVVQSGILNFILVTFFFPVNVFNVIWGAFDLFVSASIVI